MAAPSARHVLTPALAGLLLACASADTGFDTTRPTQAKAEIEETKQAAEAEPDGSTAAPPRPAEPAEVDATATQDATAKPGVVQFKTAVVEEPEPEPPSLFEAAEAERRRRESSPPSRIVITDANLGDFGEGGRLTEFVSEGGEAAASPPDPAAAEAEDLETHWRNRARDARLAWRAAHDRITELEKRVAELRHEFYATDDPHHRDGVTKPAWDRAAIDLEQARLRSEELRLQVDAMLREGYEAGALPGWLREGIEFEPETTADAAENPNDLPLAEAIDPPVVEEPPR